MKKLDQNTAASRSFADITAVDGEDLRIVYMPLILDASGSMHRHEKVVYEAVQKLLQALAAKADEDYEFRVQPIVFNDDVESAIPDFLPPEQVSELFTDEKYRCTGGTNLTKVIHYMDTKLFTRGSQLSKSLHKDDPKPTVVIVTDYIGTDDASGRSRALDTLKDNLLFQKNCNCICILCGSKAGPDDVLPLCGSRDNVIQLSENMDFSVMLSPVLIHSTINLANGTHVGGGTAEQTPAELAKEQAERARAGQQGADHLTDDQLKAEMAKLLQNV